MTKGVWKGKSRKKKRVKGLLFSSRAILPKVIPSGSKSKGLDKQFLPPSWEKCKSGWFCNLLRKDCGNYGLWNVVKVRSVKGHSFNHPLMQTFTENLLCAVFVLYTGEAKMNKIQQATCWHCNRTINRVWWEQEEWTIQFDYGTGKFFNRKTVAGSSRMNGDCKVTDKMMGEGRHIPIYSVRLAPGCQLGIAHPENQT